MGISNASPPLDTHTDRNTVKADDAPTPTPSCPEPHNKNEQRTKDSINTGEKSDYTDFLQFP